MLWAISCPWKTNIATWWHSFSCASVANVYWFAWYSQVIGLHFLGFIYHVCHYTIHINLIIKITALKKCKLMLLYWFQSSVLFNKLWIKNNILDIRFESTLAGIQYTFSIFSMYFSDEKYNWSILHLCFEITLESKNCNAIF